MTDTRTITSPAARLRDRVAELEAITSMFHALLLEVIGAEIPPPNSDCMATRIRHALEIADYINGDDDDDNRPAPEIVRQQALKTERDEYEAIRLRSLAKTYSNKWSEAMTENLAQAKRIKKLETALGFYASRDNWEHELFENGPTYIEADRGQIASVALGETEAQS